MTGILTASSQKKARGGAKARADTRLRSMARQYSRGQRTEDREQSITGATRRKNYCLQSSVFCPLIRRQKIQSFFPYHDGWAATWYENLSIESLLSNVTGY
jgi:hypothetical protein